MGSDGNGVVPANGHTPESGAGPLEGFNVLDFTRFQQGTFGSLLLADYGANIIKVEPPGGDGGRRLAVHVDGHSSYFEGLNRNKRSICLDLKRPEGREVIKRLAAQVDVVVENFRPGALEKLGLGYEVLSQINPGIVYASASGFGSKGPRGRDPGFDVVAQAAGGIMMFHRDEHDGAPRPVQGGLADQTGGMMLAHGILVALLHRERSGRGQKVDVSLYGSQIVLQGIHYTRTLYRAPLRPPGQSSGNFIHRSLCSDGRWIAFGFLEAKMWPTLARGLGLDALIDDPRFETSAARGENQGELVEIIDALVATQPAAHWIAGLRESDCPCTVVQDYAMIAEDEQAVANGYVISYEHPVYGTFRAPGHSASLSETPGTIRRHAPLYPGEHSREILQEAGYGDEEIEALLRDGAVLIGEPPVVPAGW